MTPTKAWAVVLDDRPLLTMITETRPDPSQFHPCCRIVQVEIREVPIPDVCVWTREDHDDDVWAAACGTDRLFVFTTGGPAENRMPYCCYCGLPLVEAAVEVPTYLECPCCGCEGAVSDDKGRFQDGQALICGCPGWVSVDSDGADAWINNGDEPCQNCTTLEVKGDG